MIKEESYVTLQGWMITRLGLGGNELMIYAIIWGFSQGGKGVYDGSRQYLAEWCGCSLSTVKRSLKTLMDKGLVEQVHHSKDNIEVKYIAHTEPCVEMAQVARVKMTQGLGQNEPRVGSNLTKARVKMTQAYNDDKLDDKLDNKLDNIVVDQSTPAPFKIPTIEAVKTFAERHGKAVVDPVTFYEYYQANGWKVGKNPMKDWRAAFRMWESREKGARPSGSGAKKPEDVPYMQKEYTKEHLEQKETDSMRVLDDLLGGET